jgi:hypothetical protein
MLRYPPRGTRLAAGLRKEDSPMAERIRDVMTTNP